MTFSMWTTLEKLVHDEFHEQVKRLTDTVVVADDRPSFPVKVGADVMAAYDLAMANKALAAGYAVQWVAEVTARRRLSRAYGAGIVEVACATRTEPRP